MEQAKERSLKQLMAGVDALVETSDQLVKTAVLEHRKREKIKNMELPCFGRKTSFMKRKLSSPVCANANC
jgi:protein-tyrosine kinase